MKESRSSDSEPFSLKELSRRQFQSSPKQILRGRKKSKNYFSQIIQEYYSFHLLQLHFRDKNLFPNPIEILKNLKEKQKRLQQLQKQVKISSNRFTKQNQNSLYFQPKSLQTCHTNQQIRTQQSNKNNFEQSIFKMKLRFISLTQNLLRSYPQFQKFQRAQQSKIPQLIIQCVRKLIQDFKNKSFMEKQQMKQNTNKKIQAIEQKNINELKTKQKYIQTQNKKISQLNQLLKQQTERNKGYEKQLKTLKNQRIKQNQVVRQNSSLVENLRLRIQKQISKNEQKQRTITQIKNQILNYQLIIKKSAQQNLQLEQIQKKQIRHIKSLERQKEILTKKTEQLQVRYLNRVKSEQKLNSMKMVEQNQSLSLRQKNQILMLKNQVKQQQQISQAYKNYIQQIQNKERQKHESMINVWRESCQKLVQQYEKQIYIRENLIKSLEDQIAQLRKQIVIKDDFISNNCHNMGDIYLKQ